jgi:hypothetical protein
VSIDPRLFNLTLWIPRLFYFFISAILAVIILCKIGVKYSFNTNEGWNAYWASAVWTGLDPYPGPASLKLNNYLPLWFYATGAFGSFIGDNIQAGRILASAALLLNAVAIALIVRELAGRGWSCWLAGAAFLAIFGLFHGDYAGANDPQITANFFMTVSIILFVRRIDGGMGRNSDYLFIPLMLVGGLLKHNVLSAPVSVAIYLILYDRLAFSRFVAWSAAGVAIISSVLYIEYGTNLFSSLLFPREYNLSAAWVQTRTFLARYNVFLLAIPYLALQSSQKTKFIFIYSIVSLIQGFVFSGGTDVDVNVFFDFAVSITIGLGLAENSMIDMIKQKTNGLRTGSLLAGWLVLTSMPVILSFQSGISEARLAFDAVTENPQRTDLDYVKSAAGRVLCENLAFCYWAGKEFEVDLNNLKTMVWAKPDLEREFLARIETCSYPLIQLDDDWEDYEGPLTEKMIEVLKHHYTETKKTESAVYWVPLVCRN